MKTFLVVVPLALVVFPSLAETPPPPAPPAANATPAPTVAKHHRLTYVLPKNPGPYTRVDGDAGSRGASIHEPEIFVLAPKHTGLTTAAQPSLFWYQTGPTKTPSHFTVTERHAPTIKTPKILLQVRAEGTDRGGFHHQSLAKYNAVLKPGVIYTWSISLRRNSNSPSQDIIASGTIERVAPDAQLTAAATHTDAMSKASICAGKGIWYDALEAIGNEIDVTPNNKEIRRERAILLDQESLVVAAAADRK